MFTAILVAAVFAAAETDLVAGEVTLVSEGYLFSEGPVWIPDEGLIFSDVVGNTLYRANHDVYRNPTERTNGLALDPEGRLLACESALKRITRTEADGAITVVADKFEGKSFNTTNDIAVRSDGLIYFTDPGATKKTEMSHNGVYRANPATGEITLATDTGRYPNGIGFSPDEKTLYVADYLGQMIRAYDVAEDGSLSNEREFISILNPDGFTIDTEGRIWCAAREGIVIINADGTQAGLIEIKSPTNCCFGGDDGKTLYVTARRSVFQVQTNATGIGTF